MVLRQDERQSVVKSRRSEGRARTSSGGQTRGGTAKFRTGGCLGDDRRANRRRIRAAIKWPKNLVLHGGCRNRLCPLRGLTEVLGRDDFSSLHSQHEHQLRRFSGCRVGICAVIEDTQCSELGQHGNQVKAAMLETATNVSLRNVVAAQADARTHAGNVQFRTRQAGIPNANCNALGRRVCQQPGYGASAQCGFHCEFETLRDGAFEQVPAMKPRDRIRFRLGQGRVRSEQAPGKLVGIEIVCAEFSKCRPSNAALARAVYPGKNIDIGGPGQG